MKVDDVKLRHWQSRLAIDVLRGLSDHLKQDDSFLPRASTSTSRWHASVRGNDYEVLCAGPKFYDVRAKRGGGGAVDMVMHFHQVTFLQAVRFLERLSTP